jgi:L-iditol 2-dehydrogenase
VKAVVAGAPGRIALEERAVPTPAEGEVLVHVAYAAICHTDHYVLDGRHPAVRYPVVPGHEVSGRVVDAGAGVPAGVVGGKVAVQTEVGCGCCDRCARGQVGMCGAVRHLGSAVDGGWTEYVTVPARSVTALGPEDSLLEGSLVEPSANGHAAVRVAEVRPGDLVLVTGPGPIGLLALQHALLKHPRAVILSGLEGDGFRLDVGRDLGATDVVAGGPEETAAAIRELTHGKGVDVVLQCAGAVEATRLALEVIADEGRIVIEGFAGSPETVAVSPDAMTTRRLRIEGVNSWEVRDFEAAARLLGSGKVRLRELVTHVYPLERFAEAIRESTVTSRAVKVAFEVDEPEEAREA